MSWRPSGWVGRALRRMSGGRPAGGGRPSRGALGEAPEAVLRVAGPPTAGTPESTGAVDPTDQVTRRARVAYLLLVLLALVWGVHWTVTKIGLGYLPPFTYGTLRVASAAVTLAAILGAQGRIKLPSRHDLPVVMSMGLGQIAAAIILINIALQFLPSGRTAILAYTTPLWVAVLQVLVLHARLTSRELLGLVLSLVGLAILFNPVAIGWGSSGVLAGSAMMLLSAAITGATILQVRHHRWEGSTLDLMLWELLVALVPLAVLAAVLEAGQAVDWQPQTVVCVLYSGPLATAFAFWASQSIQRALAPMATAVGLLAVPVVGIVAGAVILAEGISLGDVAGFAITLVGIGALSLSAHGSVRAPGVASAKA